MPASTNSSTTEPDLWAVILAGGVGSRFWPVSTPARPKQILPLGSDQPLVADTVDRILPLLPPGRIRILTGPQLGAAIVGAVDALTDANLMLEPRARGTAPVLVWAAHRIARENPDAVMASLHADHVISPDQAFREQLTEMAGFAQRHHRLFTIGIPPTRPEIGYGYIRVGAEIEPGASTVDRFVEKPDRDTAADYVASGDYLWNSGIFVWRAASLLDEVREHTPELAELLPLLDAGDDAAFFEHAPSLSIDEGVLERSQRVGVVRARFTWDDVGAWDAVGRTRAADDAGNVLVGAGYAVDSTGCIGWADEGTIVFFGAQDLVVVRAHGITLVAPRDRVADLKHLLNQLPADVRSIGS